MLAVHDEVSNNLVLVQPESGGVILLRNSKGWLDPVRDVAKKIGKSSTSNPTPFYRMLTDFSSDNKLLMYTPNGNVIQLLDISGKSHFL